MPLAANFAARLRHRSLGRLGIAGVVPLDPDTGEDEDVTSTGANRAIGIVDFRKRDDFRHLAPANAAEAAVCSFMAAQLRIGQG